jgi:hypothetical protein
MARSNHGTTVEAEFERVLRDRLLRTVFQPIVRVESGAVVGYEALIRGPAGSILESPDALIKEAYRQNRAGVRLDRARRSEPRCSRGPPGTGRFVVPQHRADGTGFELSVRYLAGDR